MAKKNDWAVFPYRDDAFNYEGNALKDCWPRLHLGDCEPYPAADYLERLCSENGEIAGTVPDFDGDFEALAETLQNAWRAYHRGDFQKARDLGLSAGAPGFNVANKATGIYAHYLEEDETKAFELFNEAAARAEEAMRLMPRACNAYYQRAFNLGRIDAHDYERIQAAFARGEPPPQNTPLGGQLGIHGLGKSSSRVHETLNWTQGCIALSNAQIRRLSRLIRVGMRIEVR